MDGFATRDVESRVRTPARSGPTSAEVSIRLVLEHELDEVAALFAPALERYRGSGSDWIVDAYLADLVDVRPRFAAGEVLVAERGGCVVGTVAFYADVMLEGWSNLPAGWAGFRALAVDPRMRGAGVGSALVRRCVERMREVGAGTLGIHTISLLSDAGRLYERLGFVRCPEFDLRAADIFPSDDADDMVALAFRLDVRPAGVSQEAREIGPRTVTEPGMTT